MRKIAGAFFLLVVPLLYSQDAPSLGDIARRVRAEKGKQSASTPAPSPSGASNSAASGQTAPPPAAADLKNDQLLARQKAQAGERNLHEIASYENQIRGLFNIENFDKIEQIADKARSGKTRLTGGFWAIHLIYDAIQAPPHGMFDSTESEWSIHLDRLQRWASQMPQSVTARVVLASAFLDYAWKARGGGYADQVTEEGWRSFGERSEKAGKTLIDAFNLPTKDPEWFLVMQQVMQAQEMGKEQQAAMFEKAVAFEPDYQYYYRVQAAMLMTKWNGEEGEMALFAQQAADRIGGKKGDMMYYQIAVTVNCACDAQNQPQGMSWPRIKRGFAAVEEQYGSSLVNENQMAKFAGAAGDPDYAYELFTRIGDNWDTETWETRENFDRVSTWAGISYELKKNSEDGPRTAESNMKTKEGRQFGEEINKVFQSNFSDKLSACRTLAQEPTPASFELILQIEKTGAVEQVTAKLMTKVAFCMMGLVGNGRFPAPPQPSYWVKITVP